MISIAFAFTFVVTLASTASASSSSSSSSSDDCSSIAEIACSLDDFSTLCAAVTAAGLGDALSGGHWTVFAPTNKAFDELGDLLDTVLADNDLLTDILLFHAVDDVLYAKDLDCKELTEMANGKDSRTVCRGKKIFQKGGGNSRDDMPEITSTDIKACNGVIHVVNEVLLPSGVNDDPPPEGCQSIAEIACSLDDFSTLCTAVTAAGLGDALSGGQWTVFAPTNKAFEELGSLLDAVLADNDLLTDVLLFHAVDQVLFAGDLRCKKLTKMANGKDSRTVCRRNKVYQKGSGNSRSDMPEIISTDIGACNGVIHVVDEVMLP